MISDLEKLILELHQDQAERLHRIDLKLDRILGEPTQSDERGFPGSPDLGVPFELSEKFQSSVFGNGQDITRFPLQDGLDSFFQYFEEVCQSHISASRATLTVCSATSSHTLLPLISIL